MITVKLVDTTSALCTQTQKMNVASIEDAASLTKPGLCWVQELDGTIVIGSEGNSIDRVLFKDTDAPQYRNNLGTPLCVFRTTPDGFTHLTEYSLNAWRETVE